MSIRIPLYTHPKNLGEFGIGCSDMTRGMEKGSRPPKTFKYQLKYGFIEKKTYRMSTLEIIKACLKFHQNQSTLKI